MGEGRERQTVHAAADGDRKPFRHAKQNPAKPILDAPLAQ
jgi:hypothetical protein